VSEVGSLLDVRCPGGGGADLTPPRQRGEVSPHVRRFCSSLMIIPWIPYPSASRRDPGATSCIFRKHLTSQPLPAAACCTGNRGGGFKSRSFFPGTAADGFGGLFAPGAIAVTLMCSLISDLWAEGHLRSPGVMVPVQASAAPQPVPRRPCRAAPSRRSRTQGQEVAAAPLPHRECASPRSARWQEAG
jgi:hypothetical protein